MQADLLIAIVAGAVVAVMLLSLGFLFLKANKTADEEARGERDGTSTRQATGRRNRMRAGLNRRRRGPQAAAADDGTAEGDSDEEEEEEEEDTSGMSRAERRRRARADERAAREEHRQEMDAARAAKDAKRLAKDEKYRKREEEREAAEKAALEALKKAEEERLAREDEEAARWRQFISVEEVGQDAEEDEDGGQGRLQQFIDFIKDSKAVQLDELAAEFKLSTADVVQRITQLEEQGTLTGVMDERGKFIYISLEEMAGVASYIVSRGRVSIAELAHKSSRFIDLTSKEVAGTAGVTAADLDLEEDLSGPQVASVAS